jgi:hypothetical protein
MDARTGRHTAPDSARIEVRLSGPGELAAALPHLFGFRPSESVVLLSLADEGSRLGLTVRADIPPSDDGPALARDLAARVVTDEPAGVVAVVISEAPDAEAGLPHRWLAGDLCAALAALAVPVPEVLLVRGGRWWSYDCPDSCCAPGAGTPLPTGVTELEVAAIATGVVVAPDRDALAARIAAPDVAVRTAMAAACAQVAVECAEEILDLGRDAVAERTWTVVLDAVARSRPGAPPGAARLADRELARIAWGLRDRTVRDRALLLALGDDAPAAEQLWSEVTRRSPAPLDAAPATLLAVSAWLRGDGAMAGIALDRALAGEPSYALAGLLRQALDACLPPTVLRELLGTAAADGR